MAFKSPSQPGDVHPLISDAKKVLRRQEYGKINIPESDETDEYTPGFGIALRIYGSNVHDQVIRGRRPAPDVNTVGVFDWAIQRQMQIGAPPPILAPPPGPRIPTYCFRGTGGIIGLDPVSRICQRLGDLVEEINTPWAATMGGIPVGATTGGISAPSMWTAVQEALIHAQNDFIARHKANPRVKVCVIGYSAGAIVAMMFREWILANYPQAYVASVTLGDPTRPEFGGFFGQPAAWGNGIADFALGNPTDFRHAWLTHEKDMYAQIPGGVVGEIMEAIYAEVSRFAFTDLLEFARRMLSAIPKVAEKAGISLPKVFGALAGGIPGIFAFGVPLFISAMAGLIPGGKPDHELTGAAAAARAAVIALEFLFAGTGPHINYHLAPAWPGGPTFVDFGAMHIRDYIGRTTSVALR